MTSPIPQELQMKIAELQDAILTVHPRLPILLKDIHKMLKDDPAVVTVLGEDEIATIVTGLKRQTATEITQATLKKKVKTSVSLDDL